MTRRRSKGFWEGRSVVVTGGSGMVGSHLCEDLQERGADVKGLYHSRKPRTLKGVRFSRVDLRDAQAAKRTFRGADTVFHVAARVTGIGGTTASHARAYTENMLIQTTTLEAARAARVKRYLYTSTACVYPPTDRVPTMEDEVERGAPEPTNLSIGLVKRFGEYQARLYAEEFGMKIAIVRPFNIYGPRDNFNLDSSHVVPALIRKAVERRDPFVVWGDGSATRDLVYVTDIVKGMRHAIEADPGPVPMNLSTGREVSVIDLLRVILKETGFEGARIEFDRTRPVGQMRRAGDWSLAKRLIGYEPEVAIEEGVKRTFEWYRKNPELVRA